MINGKIVDGVGGGVCQVSSTLYSAVLFADLRQWKDKIISSLGRSETIHSFIGIL